MDGMKRVAVAIILLPLLSMAACGSDQPKPAAVLPPWARVAPEQLAEAKKHGVPVAFENDIGMRFVLIPAGTFVMGSPEDEEGRDDDEVQHKVTITKPCYMQVTEVTNRQYKQFRANHASSTATKDLDGDDQPAVRVSLADCAAFAAWLGERDTARTYRLPTEAEWEYACRAGTTTRVPLRSPSPSSLHRTCHEYGWESGALPQAPGCWRHGLRCAWVRCVRAPLTSAA